MLKKIFIFILLTIPVFTVSAQKANIRGFVTDTLEKRKLEHSTILLIRSSDSILVKTGRADRNGKFELRNLSKGDYKIQISYPKMADYIRNLRLSDSSNVDLGSINMELKSKVLTEVIIQAKSAVRMKGDTLVFQADSFAVRTNANVQELLKRLPGIDVAKNGAIKAQGKLVKTVLVDGDEFFGDDPLLATRYLKANAVDEIQVYDKKSKSSDLTGIDDGIKNKTINIKLKENAKNGYLSTIDLNSSLHNLGDYGGMMGLFKHKLKAALYGNYTSLNNESKINNSMRKLKGEEYDVIEVGDDGSSIMYASGSDDDDDYISASGGLPNNLSLGAYYSDKFKDNKMGVKVNFKSFNNNNVNHTTANAQELLPNETIFLSAGKTDNNTNIAGESLKGTYNYNIDLQSTLKVSFGVSKSRNESSSVSSNETRTSNGFFISKNSQENTGQGNSEIFNGNINWSKRFKKKGRTLSIDLQPESQTIKSTENSSNLTNYFDSNGIPDRVEDIDLRKKNSGNKNSIGTRVNYTDRISKRWTLEAGYSFKTISSGSNRLVFDNIGTDARKIDSLSNNFKFINFSNVGKMILQYSYDNFSISSGLEATQTNFELQDLDQQTDFERNYLNLSPRTNIFYKLNAGTTLAINYNGYMQQPSIDQLQPVRQINNPLYQVIGNSALRPSFTNSFGVSYNSFQFKSDQYISAYFNYGFTSNAIVSTELVDEFNKRISSFVNASGNNSISGNLSYSKGFIKSHLRFGIDLGINRSNTIAIINATQNKAANTQYNLRGSLNYYTQKIEFSYIPSATLMTGKSSIGEIDDGRNVTHNHEFSGTLQLPLKFEFNTSFSLAFRPANASFGQNINNAIWNSYLSTKLLKSETLEIKLSVSDILNQRIGYNRFAGGNLTSEDTFSYIPRYVLIGLNWNISGNFIKKTIEKR